MNIKNPTELVIKFLENVGFVVDEISSGEYTASLGDCNISINKIEEILQ